MGLHRRRCGPLRVPRRARGAPISAWAACTSPSSSTSTAEADGIYPSPFAPSTRPASAAPPATDTYDLDSRAPGAPVDHRDARPAGQRLAPVLGLHRRGRRRAARAAWSSAARSSADWAACTSPHDLRPDRRARRHVHASRVRATDTAGNTGPRPRTELRARPRAAGAADVDGSPGPPVPSRAPAWSFTAEAGAGIECRSERGGAPRRLGRLREPARVRPRRRARRLVRVRSCAPSTPRATAAARPSRPYVLDTTPGAVQIDSGPGPLGRDRNAALDVLRRRGRRLRVPPALRDVAVVGWGPCVSPHGYDLAGRPDGLFRFSLRATDAGGQPRPARRLRLRARHDAARGAGDRQPARVARRGPHADVALHRRGRRDVRLPRRARGRRRPRLGALPSPFTADLRSRRRRLPLPRPRHRPRRQHRRAGRRRYEMDRRARHDDRHEPKDDAGDEPKNGDETRTPRRATAGRSRQAPRPAPAPAAPKPPSCAAAKPRTAPTSAGAPREARPERREPRSRRPRSGGGAASRPHAVKEGAGAVADHPDKSVFPMSLLLLVLGFLGVQGRIDRATRSSRSRPFMPIQTWSSGRRLETTMSTAPPQPPPSRRAGADRRSPALHAGVPPGARGASSGSRVGRARRPDGPASAVAASAGGYLVGSPLTYGIWRLSRSGAARVFGVLLMSTASSSPGRPTSPAARAARSAT